MSSLTDPVIRLSVLGAKRDEKRQRMHDLFEQQKLIKNQMDELGEELQKLDDEIDALENEIEHTGNSSAPQPRQEATAVKTEKVSSSSAVFDEDPSFHQDSEELTEPTPTMMTQHPDEHIPDPQTQDEPDGALDFFRPPSRGNSSVGPLELGRSRENRSPSSRSRSIPRMAYMSPYFLVRLVVLINAQGLFQTNYRVEE